MNRLTIYSSPDSAAVFNEITRLEKLYLTQNRKKLTVDLFLANWDEKDRALHRYKQMYGITVHYKDQADEVTFLKTNTIKS